MGLAACALTLTGAHAVAQPGAVTPPQDFFGHEIGADHFLANYTQLVDYWRLLASESDRMVLEEIGTTGYGQTMWMAVISAPETVRARERYRRISALLCGARELDASQAAELAQEGKAVVWIDGGLHATEAVAGQNILELVYAMVSRDDAEVRRILDSVVLLVCPANPDGMELVARTYGVSQRVGGLPVLYQRYCGHDNNRDFYMCNTVEARAINRVLYRRWFPQIIYNHHQTAPRGTILFTPPFRDPFNYQFDPLVVRGIDLVAAHMNGRFTAEGKAGVISRGGASYSTWWNGGLRTTAYFHNMIGILTEAFGSPNPTRVRPSLARRLPSGDYPLPIEEQPWHARQTIEYLQTANFAILDYAARYKDELLLNIYRMGRNSIRRGSGDHWTATPRLMAEARRRRSAGGDGEDGGGQPSGGAEGDAEGDGSAGQGDALIDAFADPALRDPRVYVMPSDQPDFHAATRLVDALLANGVEVHRATAEFAVDGRAVPAGSWVVQCAQAFRPHVMDMFEPQWHPDDTDAAGQPVRPYDSAGWTPALTGGIEVLRVRDALSGPFELVQEAAVQAGAVSAGGAGWLLDVRQTVAFAAVNRLLAEGVEVGRVPAAVGEGAEQLPAGSWFVKAAADVEVRLRQLAAELGVDARGVDAAPAGVRPQRAPRVGLVDVYGGNMATGWTEWVLTEYGFAVEPVFGARLNEGELSRDFDALVFATGLPAASRGEAVRRALRSPRPAAEVDLEELAAALPPFEDWSDLAARRERVDVERAIPALRAFVDGGGALLALGGQVGAAIAHLELPVEEGVYVTDDDGGERRRARRSEFFVPTSVLRARIEDRHPLARGVAAELPVVFRRGAVLWPESDAVDVAVRYAEEDLLMSGWAVGAEHLAGAAAVVSVRRGEGRVHLFGADVIFRGQPTASFKLVFNALLDSAAARHVE